MRPAGTAAGPSESLQVMLAHFSPLWVRCKPSAADNSVYCGEIGGLLIGSCSHNPGFLEADTEVEGLGCVMFTRDGQL